MNFTLAPVAITADDTPDTTARHEIYCVNEIVGYLVTYQNHSQCIRHHACIHLDSALFGPMALPIAQGFGDTADAAIRDAFDRAREEQQNYLAALASREQQLLGAPCEPVDIAVGASHG
jgi:hypothetical protein